MPPPDLTENKPAGDRLSRNNDSPEVPDFRPSGFRTLAQSLSMIMAPCYHFRFRDPSERQSAGLQSLPSARVRRLVGVAASARESASQDQWETRLVWVPEASTRVALLRRSFEKVRCHCVDRTKQPSDYDRPTALLGYCQTLGNVRREHHKRSTRRRNETHSLT